MTAEALYVPDGELLVATEYTRGPWSREHQHAGPPSALMARAIEREAGIDGGQLTRLSVDILRPVPIAPLRVTARHLRPGRRVEQLESLVTTEDGTELMRATAWRMRVEDIEVPEVDDPPPDGPDGLPAYGRPRFFVDEIAYHAALEWRFISGNFDDPGPAACWTRPKVPLVAGETPTPVEHLLVMADAASGISAVLDWQRFAFMNVDFTVHLERPPDGEWLAMDAVTRPRSSGAGVCTSVIFDARGRAGVTAQSLLVGRR